MRKLLVKELTLSASPLTYLFTLFGLMFFLPGYPVLCGAFFSTLGIFKGFEAAREANDTLFSALLPIAKRDVVKGRYAFVCLMEGCTLAFMALPVLLRMTVLSEAAVYRGNALMNANLFALGGACLLFGLFNWIFVGGFFKTAYQLGGPFLRYLIAAFLGIAVLEALHHIPGLEGLNALGTERLGLQLLLLLAGLAAFLLLTVLSCKRACRQFERVDL